MTVRECYEKIGSDFGHGVLRTGHQYHGGADAGAERISGGGLFLRQALLSEHRHLRQGQAGHLPLHLPFCGARAAVGAGEVQRMSHTAAGDRAGIHHIYNIYPDFLTGRGGEACCRNQNRNSSE